MRPQKLVAKTIVQSDKVLVASLPEKGPLQLLTFEERQVLKDCEDTLIDVMLILESTLDTICSLASVYTSYSRDCLGRPKEIRADGLDMIDIALQEQYKGVSSYKKQVKALHRKVQGTIQLVSLLFLISESHTHLTFSYQAYSIWATGIL